MTETEVVDRPGDVTPVDHSISWRTHYQVNEIFDTIQGEGILTGRAATFIRLQGCLVGCVWCDTKYTWMKGGTRMTVDEILDQVHRPYAVITGGEPTLYNLDSLLTPLKERRIFTSLETSGQQGLKGKVIPNHITLSPKERLGYNAPWELASIANEFKFVVDEALPIEVPMLYEVKFPGIPIVLMPEGCPPRPEMCEKALGWIEQQQNWIFGDRLQYRLGLR